MWMILTILWVTRMDSLQHLDCIEPLQPTFLRHTAIIVIRWSDLLRLLFEGTSVWFIHIHEGKYFWFRHSNSVWSTQPTWRTLWFLKDYWNWVLKHICKFCSNLVSLWLAQKIDFIRANRCSLVILLSIFSFKFPLAVIDLDFPVENLVLYM